MKRASLGRLRAAVRYDRRRDLMRAAEVSRCEAEAYRLIHRGVVAVQVLRRARYIKGEDFAAFVESRTKDA
jgi:hypothetical protein